MVWSAVEELGFMTDLKVALEWHDLWRLRICSFLSFVSEARIGLLKSHLLMMIWCW